MVKTFFKNRPAVKAVEAAFRRCQDPQTMETVKATMAKLIACHVVETSHIIATLLCFHRLPNFRGESLSCRDSSQLIILSLGSMAKVKKHLINLRPDVPEAPASTRTMCSTTGAARSTRASTAKISTASKAAKGHTAAAPQAKRVSKHGKKSQG